MIRVLFTFLLSIQYDSLLVVSMIHSNARHVVLLDVSSSVFMVDLKVNPNYKFCFHTFIYRIMPAEEGLWLIIARREGRLKSIITTRKGII